MWEALLTLGTVGAALGVDAGDPADAIRSKIKAQRALGNVVIPTTEELEALPADEATKWVIDLVRDRVKEVLPDWNALTRGHPLSSLEAGRLWTTQFRKLGRDWVLKEITTTYNQSVRWPQPFIVAGGDGMGSQHWRNELFNRKVPLVSVHQIQVRGVWPEEDGSVRWSGQPMSITEALEERWLDLNRPDVVRNVAIVLKQRDLMTRFQKRAVVLIDLSRSQRDLLSTIGGDVQPRSHALAWTTLRWGLIAAIIKLDREFRENRRPEALVMLRRDLEDMAPELDIRSIWPRRA